jgi:restriction endonuclease S subunit/predicted nucleotidyltransferase
MIDLSPDQLGAVRGLLARHVPGCEVRAFGSRVKWTAKSYSDLDLAVVGAAKLEPGRLAELREAFAESDLPFRVDVLDWHAISENFRRIIAEQYEVIQHPDKSSGGRGMAGEQRVRDYVALVRGITYKGSLVGKPGPALLGLGSIHPGGGFREGDYKTYGGECPPKLMLTSGDLFVSLKGATKDGKMIGSVARLPASVPSGRLTQDTVKLEFRNAERAKASTYLYWLLRTPQYRAYCEGRATGSAVVALSRDDFLDFPVPTPSRTRCCIVELLECVEKRIELNRRMNATLEAMVRALFQSWFVDFDPVRLRLSYGGQVRVTKDNPAGLPADSSAIGLAAVEALAKAGLDPATAALFPESFQDSELGPIPQGWRVTTLGKECERGGGNIQTGPFGTQLHASDYVDDGVPSIMPSDLRDNRIEISGIARIRDSDAERLSVYRVQPGDVVYSRRGDVERRSLVRREEAGWLCGTGCLRVRFGPDGLNPIFGASYLGGEDSRAWVVRHAVGATMPNLNTSILAALPMIVPPAKLQARFAEIVGPWDDRGTIALDQSRTLATLRDTLLPKLLSGELSANERETALP